MKIQTALEKAVNASYWDASCDCSTKSSPTDGRRNVTWLELSDRIKEEKTFAAQRETAKLFGVDLVLAMPVVSSVESVEIVMPDDNDD